MLRFLLPLLALLAAAPAFAATPYTLYDPAGNALGTIANPLVVTGGTGGGGNAAATSNGADGQATSSTNQQNVVFPYLFNGSTWDRMRGTGGSLSTFLSAPLPGGSNAIGSVAVSNLPALGQTTKANSQSVTLANDQGPLPTAPSAATITQTTVTLAAGTSATLIAANTSRKSLRWMVTGANSMTVVPGVVTVTAGAGMIYNAGGGAGQQGGSETFDGPAAPTNAFSAISTSGTTVTVWEGQ